MRIGIFILFYDYSALFGTSSILRSLYAGKKKTKKKHSHTTLVTQLPAIEQNKFHD